MYEFEPYGAPWNYYTLMFSSVVIEDGVTNIGSNAFYRCDSLISVDIPNSVTYIDRYAFRDCFALTTRCFDDLLLNSRHAADSTFLAIGQAIFGASRCLAGNRFLHMIAHKDKLRAEQRIVACLNADSLPLLCCAGVVPGHTEETIPGKAATLTEGGLTEGKKCSTCDEIIVKQEEIPALEFVEGKCGEDLTWTLTKAGSLTISGTGEMFDFAASPALQGQRVSPMGEASSETAPWSEYASLITKIVIQDGVTSIGDNAFSDCEKLTEVNIPATVTSIGDDVFVGCDALETVTYTGSEEQWAEIEMGTGGESLDDKVEIRAVKKGDVNGDGVVNGRDTIIIATAIANKTTQEFTAEQVAAADVNSDGTINGRDTIIIATAIANKTTDEL